MAPIFKSAAAFCLVALCGLQSTAAAQGTVKLLVDDAGPGSVLAANLARGGKISVPTKLLKEDESIKEGLKKALGETQNVLTGNACDSVTVKPDFVKKKFFVQFKSEEDSKDFRKDVQGALDKGVKLLKDMKTYPTDAAQWQTFWGNPDGANVANLLWSNSTKVGCAVGVCVEVQASSDVPLLGTNAYLFCQLNPEAEENKAPFDKKYYDALIARTTPLTAMTKDDLPSKNGATAVAVPSLLLTGLAAILATAAA
ncbi:SAG family member [Eimeria brunetti]|uniref:SAG family member n=1 Tax=Eimeria brunetti TaxID=51314 RepID=U6LM73_9EIME|nr:SAG family member [Eimeria brunetti]